MRDSEQGGLLAAPRMSAEEVAGHKFRKVRFGGVDGLETEEYLLQVADELALTARERDQALTELDRVARAASATPRHGFPGPAQIEVQGVRILEDAVMQRDRLIGDAQSYARQLGEDGERRRREIIEDARAKANKLAQATIEDATRQAAEIIAKAPMEAQAKLTTMKALAAVWERNLRALADALGSSLDGFREGIEQTTGPVPHVAGNGHPAESVIA